MSIEIPSQLDSSMLHQGEGITPDIKLSNVKVTALEADGVERVKESDLAGHLSNGNGKKSTDGQGRETGDKADKETPKSLAQEDFQLNEALNLLKGLAILQGRG